MYTEKDKDLIFFWYIAAMFLLYPSLTISPAIIPPVSHLFAIIGTCRLLKEKNFRINWRKFPFKLILILILLFNIIQAFTITWQPLVRSLKSEMFYFLSTYYLIFIGFCFAPSYYGLQKNSRLLMWISIVLFIVAGLSAISVNNFIGHGFSSDFVWASDRAGTDRGFRVTGTQGSPSIFGMINVLLFLLINHLYENSKLKLVLLFALLCNIFLSATRTPILELISIMALYYAFQNVRKKIKTILLLIPLLMMGLSIADSIPMLNSLLSGVTDLITTGGENTSGSSAELREGQLEMASFYMMQAPWLGNGLGYTNNMLSENGLFSNFYDVMLAGAEGYIYFLFIDFGIIYTVLFVIFFIAIAVFFWRNKSCHPNAAPMGICTLVLLFIHLALTRPDHSWEMVFPFVGVFVKHLIDKIKKRKTVSNC